jgi:hypothetical protein
VLHFNERGPDGLLNGKSPGQPSKLNDVQRQAIARMIESGPIPAVHGVVRWWLIDLAQWRMWRAAHVRRMDQFMPTTMPVLGLGSRFTNRDRSSTARRLFADPDS